MATYTQLMVSPGAEIWFEAVKWAVISKSAGAVLLQNGDGTATLINGTNFSFDAAGIPLTGEISQIRHFDTTLLTNQLGDLTSIVDLDLTDFFVATDDGLLGQLILRGGDTINAVLGSTVIGYGGNDTFNLAGNNFVHAVGGSDSIQGVLSPGRHDDWLSYQYNPDGTENTTGFYVGLSTSGVQPPPDEWLATGIAHDLLLGSQLGVGGVLETDLLRGINHVIGSYGNDIISGLFWTNPVTAEFSEGSEVHGLDGNDSISFAKLVYGGLGDDTIRPTSRGGEFYGEAGNDTFLFIPTFQNLEHFSTAYGGQGRDTITFSSPAGVDFDLDLGRAFLSSRPQEADQWTLLSVENATTGNGDDNITGSSIRNIITTNGGSDAVQGHNGNDSIDGGAGNDTIHGDFDPNGIYVGYHLLFGGNDRLTGRDGQDRLLGGLGNDTLVGGADADALYGEGGEDTLSYAGSNAAATVNLSTNIAGGGHAGGDTFAGFEHMLGSSHDDELTGNGLDNTLDGSDGSDTLRGGAGDDRLAGGNGIDRLAGAAGFDTFVLLPNTPNRDTILGFDTASDTLEVSAAAFGGGLVAGPLAASRFVSGTIGLAGDANDRFIYNTLDGNLFFDSNGNAAGGSRLIATLTSAPTLLAADFDIVI